MPEPRSALASVTSGPVQLAAGLSCRELTFADLVIVSAWPEIEKKVFGAVAKALGASLPEDCRTAAAMPDGTVFRTAPRRLMVVSDGKPLAATLSGAIDGADGAISVQGHSRVRIRLEGNGARALLARGMAVDLDTQIFRVGDFAQTNIHHMWVLVHRVAGRGEGDAFDIYVLRSFALSFWHWLTNTARIATQTVDCENALAH